MTDFNLIKKISVKNNKKILFLVIDGVGDIPHPDFGNKTPLEAADIPNLDRLAREGTCGLTIPISPGITPGSGPAHLSLFGYDPVEYNVGRGVLSALGVGMELSSSDVAARVNFCNIDENGIVTDRRAGRIPTALCAERCEKLSSIILDGAELIIKPEMDYRAALILRGDGLGGLVSDTDPQAVGIAPLKATGEDAASRKTAKLVNEFAAAVREKLKGYDKANMVLLRGFDRFHKYPSMQEIYKLNAACIATYPMYKGVTRLLGMETLETGDTIADEFETLAKHYKNHDFFYLHIKKTDSAGEDGDFAKKVKVLEELDRLLPAIDKLGFDVITICGDHSTPCVMKAHSWHPVPVIVHAKLNRFDKVTKFTETDCAEGLFGRFPATDLMPMVMALAGKLVKFGA